MPSAGAPSSQPNDRIGDAGAESFAGVLTQCPAAMTSEMLLSGDDIGDVGGGKLPASWRGQASGLLL